MGNGSLHFQDYISNLNRIYMVDLIDRLSRESQVRKARASLVASSRQQ